ncbi:MAG TPA: GNAT family protein [Kofleriaceae bacterium]|nr:GNAT family protein [Kofleriaceae bacterium]
MTRLGAEWGTLRIYRPTAAQVAAAAPRLRDFYNEPYNRAMLSHDEEMTADDVVDHFADLAEHGVGFLLEHGGALAGDGDLRHLEAGAGECAIMIGERGLQGQGLGTRFLTMIHALAFGPVGLARVYATIIPANTASLRLFEKLGYRRDDSPAARAYIDEPDDVSLSLERADFLATHAAALAEIRIDAT